MRKWIVNERLVEAKSAIPNVISGLLEFEKGDLVLVGSHSALARPCSCPQTHTHTQTNRRAFDGSPMVVLFSSLAISIELPACPALAVNSTMHYTLAFAPSSSSRLMLGARASCLVLHCRVRFAPFL